MYVPEVFALDDRAAIAALIRDHDFGLLVTAPGGQAMVSHLPFLYDAERGANGTLLAHMARENPQWRDFARLAEEGGAALAVFQGPHAYISPTWYGDAGPAVPTWNYLAVHAYGLPRVIDEAAAVRALLERLVATHEVGRTPPWSLESQKPGYLDAMQRGIVAFEIPVARLEAKAKLNQNRPAAARLGAAAALEAEGGEVARDLARHMRAVDG